MSTNFAPPSGLKVRRLSHQAKRRQPHNGESTQTQWDYLYRQEQARMDHEAQHGPVKILVKNGQPVTQ